jgi:glycosyltransferase involved in cell wall biosynthesis
MPYRIAHVTTVHRADDNRIYYKECTSLANAGYDTTLLAVHTEQRGPLVPNVHDVTLARVDSRIGRMTVQSARAARVAAELDADLYHIHDAELLPVALWLSRRGRTVVYDAHEDLDLTFSYKHYIPRGLRAASGRLARTIEHAIASHLSGIIAATPSIGARLSGLGVPTEVVQNFPRLEELGVPDVGADRRNGSRLLYVGAISEARGLSSMLNALTHLDASVELDLAGQFKPSTLRTAALNHPSWSRVREHGFASRKQVRELVRAANVGFVLFDPEPNYLTCYPTKMFEYMAAAVPVIASDIPFWRTLVDDERSGVTVNPKRPEMVAECVRRILDDRDWATELGNNGRAAVLSKYNWAAEEVKLLRFYSRLLSGPR